MDLHEVLKDQIHKIPPQVKHYLQSPAYPEVMRDVIKEHQIHLDAAQKVETETTMLLIGLVAPSNYEQKLIENVGLGKEQAREIAKSMNEKVFKPLVESYKKPTPQPSINVFADEVASEIEPPKENIPAPEPIIEEPPVVQEPPAQETPKVEEKKIEKKYAIDPYREPIE